MPARRSILPSPDAARAASVEDFLAVPLLLRDAPVGALDVFLGEVAEVPEDVEAVAALLAAQASVVLANVRTHEEVRRQAGQLQEALASRAVIEQAKGVLVAMLQIDPEAALGVLRDRSTQTSTKLREVAADVVRRGSEGRPQAAPARRRDGARRS